MPGTHRFFNRRFLRLCVCHQRQALLAALLVHLWAHTHSHIGTQTHTWHIRCRCQQCLLTMRAPYRYVCVGKRVGGTMLRTFVPPISLSSSRRCASVIALIDMICSHVYMTHINFLQCGVELCTRVCVCVCAGGGCEPEPDHAQLAPTLPCCTM